jgi:hypothetical protein
LVVTLIGTCVYNDDKIYYLSIAVNRMEACRMGTPNEIVRDFGWRRAFAPAAGRRPPAAMREARLQDASRAFRQWQPHLSKVFR